MVAWPAPSVTEEPEASVAEPLVTVQVMVCPETGLLPPSTSRTSSGSSAGLPVRPLWPSPA